MTGRHRHLAAPPWEADLLVAGESETEVEVISRSQRKSLATFPTILSPGVRRLAIVTGGPPIVLAGAWSHHGVRGYSLVGEVVWQNKVRSQVQRIETLSSDLVAVCYESQPAAVLRAATGRIVTELRGVRDVHAIDESLAVLVTRRTLRIANERSSSTSRQVGLVDFGVLDAAGHEGRVAIAEAGGPLRLFDAEASEVGRFAVEGGHVLSVALDPITDTWVAVVRRLDRAQEQIVRLDHDASLLERRPCPPVFAWCRMDRGRSIVLAGDSGLYELDTSTATIKQLAFAAVDRWRSTANP